MLRMPRNGYCSVDLCVEKIRCRGLCDLHYHQKLELAKRTNPCECGCGEFTSRRFVWGHQTRLFSREEQSRRGQQNDGSKQRDRGLCVKTYRKVKGRHEHRVVMEQILGRPLRRDEIVHHKNRNIRDNRPENLELMTPSAHAIEHNDERVRAFHASRL